MEAPPVHYATTRDGFKIAYTIRGNGPTLIYMPFSIGNVAGPSSRRDSAWGQSPQLRRLLQHLRIVRYDHRGQGSSTRGLKSDHSLEAYEWDLEAVLDCLGTEPVFVMAGALSSHVAVRYAARNPERVRGLILYRTGVTLNSPAPFSHDLAASDWDLFLNSFLTAAHANEQIPPEERRIAITNMKTSVSQADWLEYARVAEASSVEEVLHLIRMPTLVLATSGHLTIPRENAARVASLIPNARLVAVDELGALVATAQPVLDFIASLPPIVDSVPSSVHRDGLSERELEVLRLVATGRSNQQIADKLVITLSTVTKHVGSILGKTESANRTEAAGYARDHGIV